MIHLGEVRSFDALKQGIVSVGVPTENDAVQVHRHRDYCDKARLAVVIEPGALTVAREDDLPLQIQSHFDVHVDGEGYRKTSQLLFEEPVPRMTFVRSGGLWAAEGFTSAQGAEERLRGFVSILGDYTLRKQNEQRRTGQHK